MQHTDVITYLKTWATNFIPLSHQETDEGRRFYHNIDELDDQQQHMKAGQFYMVMEDRHTGQIGGSKENYRDQPRFAVSFVRKVEPTKWFDEEVAFTEGKIIALKLIGYMANDHHHERDTIARFIREGSFSYRRIGPQLDNLHGCQLTWELSSNINDTIQYNPADYI